MIAQFDHHVKTVLTTCGIRRTPSEFLFFVTSSVLADTKVVRRIACAYVAQYLAKR